jgi:hypothetical protein
MKTKTLLVAITLLSGLIFSSCERNEPFAQPTILLTELGFENSLTAYIGSDLHIEADVVADGRIEEISIEIHAEENNDSEWAVDTIYTEFSGLKNTNFHKHLEVPANANPGDYHFHFTVTDMTGQQTTVESELTILQAED